MKEQIETMDHQELQVTTTEQYIKCFQALLQATMESERNAQVVHQVMQNHLESLNEGLIPVLKTEIPALLTQIPELFESIAALVQNLSVDFYQFPLENRRDNLEIPIAGFDLYRFELYDSLKWELPNPEEEKEAAARLNTYLKRGY